jgi:hypothetical protein
MIGRIYRLEGGGKFYIGSTTCNMKNRLKHHRSKSKEPVAQKNQMYIHFRELGWQNVSVVVLQEFEINSRKDLLLKETEIIKEFIEHGNCLNKNIPIITREEKKKKDAEYGRKRRSNNPEDERNRLKEWRKNNPEKWKAQTKRYNENKKKQACRKDISCR